MNLMTVREKKFEVEGKSYTFESGKLAKQADGAITVRLGDTIVLVTAVAQRQPREGADFLPLTIDVDEKMYAAGKIPGSFFRREGRPSETATLTARLIDRPLRPSFPKGYFHETQVMITVLSVDHQNPPDVLALNGASAALMIGGTPFEGPVGGVRVGRVNGQWIINPTFQDLDESDIDLVVAGTDDAILMVEAGARQVTEEDMVVALAVGHEGVKKMITAQREFQAEAGKERWEFVPPELDIELESRVKGLAVGRLEAALRNPDKLAREEAVAAVKRETVETLQAEFEDKERSIKDAFKSLEKQLVRELAVNEGLRVDGRRLDEIRKLDAEVGVLPRAHGTGLFTRGQTQALSVLTLGTLREEQMIDGLGIEESKRFMHHYNFPPFSVGETGRLFGPKRREIGHGALGERAILQVLPDEEAFPYTIRIVSEILESNGSTSMASICGSTLALLDAGVPIQAPVAGIAMGLVKEGDSTAVLTDIQGVEDALGDMDFKVAGTRAGIVALQMDMKVKGVGSDVLRQALEQARQARLTILDKIESVISAPRAEMSPFAPRIITIKIPTEKIREVIGPGGKVVQGIIAETGATIDIEDDGTIFVASRDGISGEKAKQLIEAIVKDVEPGDVFVGRVTKVMPFGAFVELKPGREGLVHISKLAPRRIEKVEDVVREGDSLPVRVLDIDRQNRVSLTAVDVEAPKEEKGSAG
jgi:polyribonucleotide nucleotidyltransferase